MTDKEETSKPFWMKFYGRFFDKHEIKILLDMDRDFVFFYIAMLLESVAHRGLVRFNDKIPYSANMLSHLLNMPSQKIEDSMKVLSDFGLLEVLSDGTIFLPAAPAMCGCGSDSAERMRKLREKRKLSTSEKTTCSTCANMCEHVVKSDGSIEYRDKSIENRDKNNNIIIPQTPFLKKNTPQNITTEVNHDDDDDACPSLTHDHVQSNGYMALKFPREKIAKLVLGIACASSKFKKEYAEPFTDYVFSTAKLEAASGNPRAYLVRIFNDWLSSGLFDKNLHRITRDEFSLVIQDLNKSRDSKIDKQMESECWDWVVSQESDSYGHEISKYSVKSLITNFMAKRTARRNDEKSRREEQEAQEVANKALDEQRIAYGLTYEIEEV